MSPDEFQQFTERVMQWAQAERRVLGVVALGSTAGISHRPDQWSDHDLFLIVEPGAAASLRDDVSWLPNGDRIVLVHPETAHGRAVVYDDGHLVEFAVFTENELDVARVNDYAVLLDRCGLGPRMAQLAARTASETRDDRGEAWRVGALAKELIIGVSRYARGERISANERVRGTALRLLVELIHGPVPSTADQSDNLDPTRRLERTHPAVATRLASALDTPLLFLVSEMISIVENDVMRGSGDLGLVLDAVRTVLQRAQSASCT